MTPTRQLTDDEKAIDEAQYGTIRNTDIRAMPQPWDGVYWPHEDSYGTIWLLHDELRLL